jgi:hypothetical protein
MHRPHSIEVERYSTLAEFELVANGQSYDVGQVSSDFIILDKPADIPPGEADLFIRVEGEELHRRIRLPRGATSDTDQVVIERL